MKTKTTRPMTFRKTLDRMMWNRFGVTLYDVVLTSVLGAVVISAIVGEVMKTMLFYKLWSLFY